MLLTGVAIALNDPAFTGARALLAAGALLLIGGPVLAIPAVLPSALRYNEAAASTVSRRYATAVRWLISALALGAGLTLTLQSVAGGFVGGALYERTRHAITGQQIVYAPAAAGEAGDVLVHADAVPGVDRVIGFPTLQSGCAAGSSASCLDAVVASCDELRIANPGLTGCVENRPQWIDTGARRRNAAPSTWSTAGLAGVRVSAPTSVLSGLDRDGPVAGRAVKVPRLLKLDNLVLAAPADIYVSAPAGTWLAPRLADAGMASSPNTNFGFYDYIGGLSKLAWIITVLTLVLLVSYFAVAIAAVRATRCTPQGRLHTLTMRRRDWARPVLTAVLVGGAGGALAGGCYLAVSDGSGPFPILRVTLLAGIGLGVGAIGQVVAAGSCATHRNRHRSAHGAVHRDPPAAPAPAPRGTMSTHRHRAAPVKESRHDRVSH